MKVLIKDTVFTGTPFLLFLTPLLISTWSSEPREVLTVCRYRSKVAPSYSVNLRLSLLVRSVVERKERPAHATGLKRKLHSVMLHLRISLASYKI